MIKETLYFALWILTFTTLVYSVAINVTGNAPIKTKRIVLALQIPVLIYVIWSIMR